MTQCAEERLDAVVPQQGPPPCASSADAGEEPVDVAGLEGLLLPRVGLKEPLGHPEVVSARALPAPSQKIVLEPPPYPLVFIFSFSIHPSYIK